MLAPADQTILQRRVRPLVTADLVARHAAHPFGPHDPDVLEVLHFVRRSPDPQLPSYVVLALQEPRRWMVGARPPGRGEPLEAVDDAVYPTRAAAEHGVFVRRLGDYGLLPAGIDRKDPS
jgi:hypothetical protein